MIDTACSIVVEGVVVVDDQSSALISERSQ